MLLSARVSVLCMYIPEKKRSLSLAGGESPPAGCLLPHFPASGFTWIHIVPVPWLFWALLHLSVMTHYLFPSSSQMTRYPGLPPVAHYCNLWTRCGPLRMSSLAARFWSASTSPAPVQHPGISCLGMTWHCLILFFGQVSLDQTFWKRIC